MRAKWELPTSYSAFTRRLKKMNLHDAIEKPRAESQVRVRKTTPIQDNIRRTQTLRNERIAVLDFDQLAKLEKREVRVYTKKVQPPKQNLLTRFISFFKAWQKNKKL